MSKSQCTTILAHLKTRPITPLEAIEKYGILRLGARIYDLRHMGHGIDSRRVTVKNRKCTRW